MKKIILLHQCFLIEGKVINHDLLNNQVEVEISSVSLFFENTQYYDRTKIGFSDLVELNRMETFKSCMQVGNKMNFNLSAMISHKFLD